jgi:predicted GNAT family acetyltransferase
MRWLRHSNDGELEEMDVRHNPERQRYEIVDGEQVVGIAEYREEGETLTFFHTEVDPPLRGRGIGAQLVAGALADVQARGLRVRPLCWFVRDYIAAHPDLHELLAA